MPGCTRSNSVSALVQSWLERQWYRHGLWSVVLLPLDLLMRFIAWSRYLAYQAGLKRAWRAPVPVVVVGNITVGGTGKTPLVLWLVDFLRTQGWHPGIISRGYGGQAQGVMQVTATSHVDNVGDEPLLMARRARCPLWVGRDRPAAARALLAAHPECDVLVSDDGLQHYALARDVEIVVVDGARMYGNRAMLPVGPLREPLWRLNRVDAVVINGGELERKYGMALRGDRFRRLCHDAETAGASEFSGKRLHAIAGIGNPARFFSHLRVLGLDVIGHAFPDHHRFSAADLQIEQADAILMTEKDAVKCFAFAPGNAWYLPVSAEISGGLGEKILEKISKVN
jgi:tetraacyldisaccharide 4'-kinase